MALIILSSRCMYIVLSSTIGSGAPHGMHGIRLGIGAITPAGGMCVIAGLTTAIGITAMRSITVITDVRSAQGALFATVILPCKAPFPVETTPWRTPTVRSPVVTRV